MSKFRSLVGDAERLGLSTTDALRAVVKTLTKDDWSPEARAAAIEARKKSHTANIASQGAQTSEHHTKAAEFHTKAQTAHAMAPEGYLKGSMHNAAAEAHGKAAASHAQAAKTSDPTRKSLLGGRARRTSSNVVNYLHKTAPK